MTIAYACSISHAPGYVAWPDAAPIAQKQALDAGADQLRRDCDAAGVDALIMFTAEHWTNFFLDHISAICIGRGDSFQGPVEPWLKMEKKTIPGLPALASALLETAYAQGMEASFSYELAFDHGTMIPISVLTPAMTTPVVPIFINTLAAPQPSPARCFALGRIVGDVARASDLRIGLVATGGMSHDPGERNHGLIDEAFDHRFLEAMTAGDVDWLQGLSIADLSKAGAGAVELLNWIALAGAMRSFSGKVAAYEAVKPWATGMGLMDFRLAA